MSDEVGLRIAAAIEEQTSALKAIALTLSAFLPGEPGDDESGNDEEVIIQTQQGPRVLRNGVLAEIQVSESPGQ